PVTCVLDPASPWSDPSASPRLSRDARRWRWHNALLGWLVSLVLHSLLMIVVGYIAGQQLLGIRHTPFDSIIDSPAGAFVTRFSNVVVADAYFDDERSVEVAGADSPSDSKEAGAGDAGSAATASLTEIASAPPPVDATAALPSADFAAVNAGEAVSGTAAGAGGLLNGPHRPGGSDGKFARTHVYGAAGEGNTFVYVFDRSSSMSAGGNNLLASAKRELLASLDDLGEENRFHIIFYNERPTGMDLGRGFAGLVFADQRAKQLARRFIDSILAGGGTRHFEALKEALRLQPDVIFFLTDADEPEMSDGQLSLLRHLNGGRATINTIEFGDRPQPRRDNFLSRIAGENGGQYVYVDVTRQ
ncbi:MAG TPA: hypothetical protein VGX78_06880, partial [Pirellulales bacterium]|nr:hypothetical protein [Pirellulales bacterium]